MDYLIHEIQNRNHSITTKQKSRTETQIINKEKTKKQNMKNYITQSVDQKHTGWETKEMQENQKMHDKTGALSSRI